MARGGKRQNAGRKRGIRNRRTRELLEHVEAGGVLPLDYLLQTMRNPKMPRAMRFEAAKIAAPYCHPRLQAIEHSGKAGAPPILIQQPEITDDDRAKALAVFLAPHKLKSQTEADRAEALAAAHLDAQREGGG